MSIKNVAVHNDKIITFISKKKIFQSMSNDKKNLAFMSLIQDIVSLLGATPSDKVRVNNMVLTFPNSRI